MEEEKREWMSCCYPKELKGQWKMKERCADEREMLRKSPWINEAVGRISANSDMSEVGNGFVKALFKKKALNAKWKRVGSEEIMFFEDNHWWKAEEKAAGRSLNICGVIDPNEICLMACRKSLLANLPAF